MLYAWNNRPSLGVCSNYLFWNPCQFCATLMCCVHFVTLVLVLRRTLSVLFNLKGKRHSWFKHRVCANHLNWSWCQNKVSCSFLNMILMSRLVLSVLFNLKENSSFRFKLIIQDQGFVQTTWLGIRVTKRCHVHSETHFLRLAEFLACYSPADSWAISIEAVKCSSKSCSLRSLLWCHMS